MGLSAIYLSGCEYNRLLHQDPTVPQTSFIPAEPLWKSTSQFWLFEHVYCTKESVDCERAFADEMGFASSRIVVELVNEDIIKPFDLASMRVGSRTHEAFTDAHRGLRGEYNEQTLRAAIRSGDTATLDNVKLRLLRPIQDSLGCSRIDPG